MRWLVWLFGVMLAWILYEVSSNAVSKATDDPWLPMVIGLMVSVIVGGIVVWLVKRNMPG